MGIRCGRSQMWIWRQLYQNKGLDFGKAAKALGLLKVPVRFFLEEITEALPAYEPYWVLEYFRPRAGVRDPFLATLEKGFWCLLELPFTPGLLVVRRQREIEALELMSQLEPKAAKIELEILGCDLLDEAETVTAGGRGPARGQLVDCARLLLVWGAVQRAHGALDDAVDALALAYRFGVAAGDTAVLGLFFHDSARLLSDLGQPGLSLRFAQAAARHFQLQRDRRLLPMALFQCSRAYLQLGQRRDARIHALAALRLAGRDDWRIRPVAWIQLASLAKARGDFRRAFGLLERAKKNCRSEELKASIHGRQAVFLALLGHTKKAARAFDHAMRYLDRRGRYQEIAAYAAELAEALILKGRFAAALELVRTVTPRFERLSRESPAPALWLDLCALILDGNCKECRQQVSRVREALARADASAFSARA
jgi:tetratricopeptide (TPR) repeat protein